MPYEKFWRKTAVALGITSIILLTTFAARAQRKEDVHDLASFVRWVQATHKAPFDRDAALMPPGGRQELKAKLARIPRSQIAAVLPAYKNIKVNQDRNPWPKAEVAAAVDFTGDNYVVMTNDFRLNFDHEFFHVSTDVGKTWTDDALTGGLHPATGGIPGAFQSDPGVSFDRVGHSYLSTVSGNLIFDPGNNYQNMDTEIEEVQGFANGTYADVSPNPIDDEPCNGAINGTGMFTCDTTLDKPLITTDTSGTATDGTTYVYYTLICLSSKKCSDGTATNIPAMSSVILESHSAGAGLPFTSPALVSGKLENATFADMVVDNEGIPHIFFDDFTDPSIKMWVSTFNGSSWIVSAAPVANFNYSGLHNINWMFRDIGTVAPGCGVHQETAYCAFSATQIVGGPEEGTPSVYVAAVDLDSAKSTISRVNNDLFRNGKHHFFPWATTITNGTVYVGWYDDRRDPFESKVEYWVGKSTDHGKTFAKQQAVSDTAFNPCTGSPACGFFGDYTQLVAGPNGVVHAAWTDTRDQASQQIWSQVVTF